MTGTGTSHAEKYQWIKKKKTKTKTRGTYFLHEENSICTKLREQGRKLPCLGIQNNHRSLNLQRKRFCVVPEQRKTKEWWGMGFSVLAAWKMEQKPHFSLGLWLSFLILCSKTARKHLLQIASSERTLFCYLFKLRFNALNILESVYTTSPLL